MAKGKKRVEVAATYLGDGVYVKKADNGMDMIELYTFDGLHVKDKIFLEPEVFQALLRWVGGQYKVEIRAVKT